MGGAADALRAALLLAGCVAGPDYVRPAVATPPAWKLEAPWRAGAPDDAAPKGPWWQRFGDARLDALQQQAIAHSPTLVLAAARLEQARAVVAPPRRAGAEREHRRPRDPAAHLRQPAAHQLRLAQLLDGAERLRAAACRSATSSTSPAASGAASRARAASAEQSAADLENTRLLLGADLATAYFNLRATDIELDVVARSIALQQRSLDFVRTRHDLGVASGLEVAQQQALLDTTLTQVDLLRRQRGLFEHAVATLTGTPAPSFELAPDIAALEPPTVPLGVPSDVLQRRPDVASAERAMAAANAQIGVAAAAYYPSITISPVRPASRPGRSPACSRRRACSGRSARP